MDKEFRYNMPVGLPFSYQITITQVVAAPATIGFQWTIPTDEILFLEDLWIQAGTVGAGRSILASKLRSGVTTRRLMRATLTTGQFMQNGMQSISNASNITADSLGSGQQVTKFYPGEILYVVGSSFANTETFNAYIIGRILSGILPTVGIESSGKNIEMIGAGIVDGTIENVLLV